MRRFLLLIVFGLGMVSATPASAAAPKAYIGVFKDDVVAVLDATSQRVQKTIPVPPGPHGLVVTPDGRRVYVSSDGDSTVSVVDTRADEIVDSVDVGKTPHGLAITPDGSTVLVAGFGSDRVLAIDTANDRITWQTPVGRPHNLAISTEYGRIYAASQADGAPSLTMLDLATGAEVGRLPLDHTPRALSVSPDGDTLLFTLAGVDAVQVLDLTTNQLRDQVPTGASPHHPVFSADGTQGLVVSQGPGTLDVFDVGSHMAMGSIAVGKMPHWIALTDGRALVTNEGSGDVSIVDLAGHSVVATVPVGNGPRKIVVQPALAAGAAVSMSGFAFAPASVSIKAGESVTFTNNDAVIHTSTAEGGVWDSGDVAPGVSYTLTLDQPGTYRYLCTVHPFMSGTITVSQ